MWKKQGIQPGLDSSHTLPPFHKTTETCQAVEQPETGSSLEIPDNISQKENCKNKPHNTFLGHCSM